MFAVKLDILEDFGRMGVYFIIKQSLPQCTNLRITMRYYMYQSVHRKIFLLYETNSKSPFAQLSAEVANHIAKITVTARNTGEGAQ